MTTTIAVAGRRDDRFFFVGMALAMAATVFAGFAPTFYARPGTLPTLSTLLVVHGTLFTSGMLIIVLQALRLLISGTSGWLAFADWLQH